MAHAQFGSSESFLEAEYFELVGITASDEPCVHTLV